MAMRSRQVIFVNLWWFALASLLLGSPQAPSSLSGQAPTQTGHQIRVKVALVQTDVMVFDRENRFVDNLKREQLEFRVDGKPQPISFFDLVSAGTPRDEEIWARMDRRTSGSAPAPAPPATPAHVGRTILFFVDDWHLSADSMMRARTALQKLIEDSVGINDQAALVAASGQLGFLQQFTNDKAVLRAAAAKLAGGSIVEDTLRPPMNEAMAARIVQGDANLENYFTKLQADVLGGRQLLPLARLIIRDRAQALSNLSAAMAERSLSALKNFVKSASMLPGRKLVFFLSDGFALQLAVSDIVDRLRQLTTAAANAGIVIYTLDTRGLEAGLRDAKTRLPGDPDNDLIQSPYNAVMDFQDGLNALAADTGGRFLRNTNAFDTAISTAMAEASRYYLLGWYVDPDLLKPGRYWSLHVSIKDRPDLKVRLRAGLVDLSQSVPIQQNKPVKPAISAKDAADQLKHALGAPFQMDELPVSLYAGWILDPEQGPMVAVSYQVDAEAVQKSGPVSAEVISAVANHDGVAVDQLSETLSRTPVAPVTPSSGRVALRHTRSVHLDPGLYQVRVAARDPMTGRLGSAWQWIEVPPSPDGKMGLGSIYLSDQDPTVLAGPSVSLDALNRARFSIRRRFIANAQLFFFANVYNTMSPLLEIQTTIHQGNHALIQPPPQYVKAAPEGRGRHLITVNGRFALEGLAPGAYILEITAKDLTSNETLSQRIQFWIVP
ncbi:MAG: VWA domain-containing protein [Acidobacteriota bacterium]